MWGEGHHRILGVGGKDNYFLEGVGGGGGLRWLDCVGVKLEQCFS